MCHINLRPEKMLFNWKRIFRRCWLIGNTGICPIREELYSQTFDEIIRQVAVDCPERGLLLMRVRDELKMTLAAYETIYQSSITYGLRKQVESEEGNDALEH